MQPWPRAQPGAKLFRYLVKLCMSARLLESTVTLIGWSGNLQQGRLTSAHIRNECCVKQECYRGGAEKSMLAKTLLCQRHLIRMAILVICHCRRSNICGVI